MGISYAQVYTVYKYLLEVTIMGGLIPRGVCAHTGYCSPVKPQIGCKFCISMVYILLACMSPLGNFTAKTVLYKKMCCAIYECYESQVVVVGVVAMECIVFIKQHELHHKIFSKHIIIPMYIGLAKNCACNKHGLQVCLFGDICC